MCHDLIEDIFVDVCIQKEDSVENHKGEEIGKKVHGESQMNFFPTC